MIQPSEDESRMVERGIAAETLLQDPVFGLVINELANHYMQGIVNSKPEQAEDRNGFYHAIKSLQGIQATLNEWVGVKEQIVLNLNDITE